MFKKYLFMQQENYIKNTHKSSGKIVNIVYAGIPFRLGRKVSSSKEVKDRLDLAILGLAGISDKKFTISFDVYGITEDEYLIAKPLEKEGKVILKCIMEGGNFGHHSEKGKRWKRYGKVFGTMTIAQHNLHLVRHYPMDALTAPLWPVWHFFWKRLHRSHWSHRNKALR